MAPLKHLNESDVRPEFLSVGVAVMLAVSTCPLGCQEREPEAVHRTEVAVPVVRGGGPDARRPALLVEVDADAMRVSYRSAAVAWREAFDARVVRFTDESSWWEGLSAEDVVREQMEREGLDMSPPPVRALALEEGRVSREDLRGGRASLEIRPLYEALTEAVVYDKKMRKFLGLDPQRRLAIAADADIPVRTVNKVLYTGAQADLLETDFWSRGPDGLRGSARLTDPHIHSHHRLDGEPIPEPGVCARPTVELASEGVRVSLREGRLSMRLGHRRIGSATMPKKNDDSKVLGSKVLEEIDQVADSTTMDEAFGQAADDAAGEFDSPGAIEPNEADLAEPRDEADREPEDVSGDDPDTPAWAGAALTGPNGACRTVAGADSPEQMERLNAILDGFDAAPSCGWADLYSDSSMPYSDWLRLFATLEARDDLEVLPAIALHGASLGPLECESTWSVDGTNKPTGLDDSSAESQREPLGAPEDDALPAVIAASPGARDDAGDQAAPAHTSTGCKSGGTGDKCGGSRLSGRISWNEPLVEGPGQLDVDAYAAMVKHVVERRLSELHDCYESTLRRIDPKLSGKLVVSLTIGADGRVESVEISEGMQGREREFRDCVRRHITQWRFPRPAGVVRVEQTFQFGPADN